MKNKSCRPLSRSRSSRSLPITALLVPSLLHVLSLLVVGCSLDFGAFQNETDAESSEITIIVDAGVSMDRDGSPSMPQSPRDDDRGVAPDVRQGLSDAGLDAGVPPGADTGLDEPDVEEPVIACEPTVIFEQNGCASAGCHGDRPQAGLDLRRADLEDFLIGAPAHSAGCGDRLLIDPFNVERSLILQVVGAAPIPDGDPCQVTMPMISEEQKECLTAWVDELTEGIEPPEEVFTESTLRSSLQKVKTLLNGGALTHAELEQVAGSADEKSAMRDLYQGWADGPAFDRKMMSFLKVNLQQQLQSFETDQFDRLRVNRDARRRVQRVMEESFTRTALHLINNGLPFNRIANTQTWMVTTANLVLLLYGDQSQAQRARRHVVFSARNGRPIGLRQQINRRQWYLDRPEIGECDIPQTAVLNFLFGALQRRSCEGHQLERNTFRFGLDESVLTEEDFNDWRLVTFDYTPNQPDSEMVPFYDVRRLRTSDTLSTRIPRVGYFTTNAFFENWLTNVDNQFRVAVNQSLLVGLNIGFSASEGTEPVNPASIAESHANPNIEGGSCYGCHRHIDPMRVYFSRAFNVNYQRPFGAGENAQILNRLRPGFAFRGLRRRGGSLMRFGDLIGNHPRFATAWIQRLCMFANSSRCDETDERFRAIVERFRQTNFDLKTAMIELFASPLVSGRSQANGAPASPMTISISRRDHLCALLAQRTGRANICSVNRVAQIIGLIPNDDFARGAADPTQTARPSPIFFAAAESTCMAVARTVVNNNNRQFPANQPQRTLENIVHQLMGLESDPDRADEVIEILAAHYEQVLERGNNRTDALRSAFVVGCISPDVMGVGL